MRPYCAVFGARFRHPSRDGELRSTMARFYHGETDVADEYLHAADAVGQILKGIKPGDIPFYLVRKFTFSINLSTAKALGVKISSNLLAQADEVIE